ncbi:hypothetical protein ACJJTC_003139 [Scirpophaga incertulas]
MKCLVVLAFVLAVAFAETYSDKHDGLDVEALVTNPEALHGLSHCFLDAGTCDDIAAAFKKVLPEATQTACAKCTPAQKHMLKRHQHHYEVFGCSLVVLVVTLAETYSDKNDSLDVEALVTNQEALHSLTQCFLDTGACDEISAAAKKVLPEATQTACAKCTPAQKHMLKRYLEEVKKTSPADFEALKQKYDPQGQYIEGLRAALADA